MSRRIVFLAGGAVLGLVMAAAGWYFFSPLLIENRVNEAFPFELPDQQELADMPGAEIEALESEFLEAVPSSEQLSQLSEEERQEVSDKVQVAAAAVMSDEMVDDPDMVAEEDQWVLVAQGQFVDADSFHQGSGQARVFQLDEQRVLRFEEFEVTNGPDLHVILTRNPSPARRSEVGDDYVDLGSLKGNVGNQNYDIPPEVDLAAFRGVVIYCVPFHVVFATATLS